MPGIALALKSQRGFNAETLNCTMWSSYFLHSSKYQICLLLIIMIWQIRSRHIGLFFTCLTTGQIVSYILDHHQKIRVFEIVVQCKMFQLIATCYYYYSQGNFRIDSSRALDYQSNDEIWITEILTTCVVRLKNMTVKRTEAEYRDKTIPETKW